MGFISLLVADAAIAGVLAVVIGLLALAALLAVVGIVTSVVFAAGTERRHARGKRLGAKVAIPITCLVFSGLIMGGLFVAETLSVMVQVLYCKCSGGKRIFRMAPLHHHYELSGWKETQVVVRF